MLLLLQYEQLTVISNKLYSKTEFSKNDINLDL